MSTQKTRAGGYTLVELIVAVGLFSIVMTLATGAYLIMIGANRQTQGLATGINNLTFVLNTMTISMRTGNLYCEGSTYCSEGGSGTTFSFRDQGGRYVTYGLVGTTIESCTSTSAYCAPNAALTAPAITVNSLVFKPSGTPKHDGYQPYVSIYMTGVVNIAPGKTQSFAVETGVAMRVSDL